LVEPPENCPGGKAVALPPPMYRHEEPRSAINAEQAVSESISPENGAVAGVERPAPPQDVVPAVVVYLSDSGTVVLVVLDVVVVAVVLVVVVLAHSVAPLQVPLGPQVQVPAVHAAMTLLVQAANAPPLNPDSAALPAQFLRLQGAGDGAAICPNEGTTLSQKRAATTVIVRVTVPMTSSVLPRGQAPRESCSSANRR